MEDRRIFHFTSVDVKPWDFVLPEQLLSQRPLNMIYAAGDAMGGFNKTGNYDAITNIEAFSKLGYNVFVCQSRDSKNIEYLAAHPELNIVLCIFSAERLPPIWQESRLVKLFKNSIKKLDTDDTRIFPSSKCAFDMLVEGGVASLSLYWSLKGSIGNTKSWLDPANFSILGFENRLLKLQKTSAIKFTASTMSDDELNEKIKLYRNQQAGLRKTKHSRKRIRRSSRKTK